MKQGIIVRVDSSLSEVYEFETDNIFTCQAQGKLKSKNGIILGDHVEFESINEHDSIIKKVAKRKNEIYRPKIANIDFVFLICSCIQPDIDTTIIDKYLMYLELSRITPILVFTKIDLIESEKQNKYINNIIDDYKNMNYESYVISNKNPDIETLKLLENKMETKLSIFTGQTGAGKSSLINNLLKEEKINTQEISLVLNRGKHTTTNAEIHILKNNALVADSPGFSSFNLMIYTPYQLAWGYRAFDKYKGMCKFNDCIHDKEKGCEIKKAVEENKIPKFLYNDYLSIIKENEKRMDSRW